jgi:hypothetical protein
MDCTARTALIGSIGFRAVWRLRGFSAAGHLKSVFFVTQWNLLAVLALRRRNHLTIPFRTAFVIILIRVVSGGNDIRVIHSAVVDVHRDRHFGMLHVPGYTCPVAIAPCASFPPPAAPTTSSYTEPPSA